MPPEDLLIPAAETPPPRANAQSDRIRRKQPAAGREVTERIDRRQTKRAVNSISEARWLMLPGCGGMIRPPSGVLANPAKPRSVSSPSPTLIARGQQADAPYFIRWLRARRERPHGCAAEHGDEVAPSDIGCH
jgi:hypothetical protein